MPQSAAAGQNRRRVRPTLLAFAVAMSVLTLACGGSSSPGGQDRPAAPATTDEAGQAAGDEPQSANRVTSPDGSATLAIPVNSLADGVALADISVVAITDDALSDQETNGESGTLARVELRPDGLQFGEPVQVAVSVPADSARGTTFAVHASGKLAEVIPIEVRADPDGNPDQVSLVASISHFSDLIFFAGVYEGAIEVSVSPSPVQATVGDTIVLQASIARTTGDVRGSVPLTVSRTGEVTADSIDGFGANHWSVYTFTTGDDPWDGQLSWSLAQTFQILDMGPQGSGELEFLDRSTAPTRSSATTIECLREGHATIKLRVRAYIMTSGTPVAPQFSVEQSFEKKRLPHIVNLAVPVECAAPKIVASAAPPLTTYTLDPEVAHATNYVWSGADCGSVTGSTTSMMIWDHGAEDCEHAGEAHSQTRISVLVRGTLPDSGETFELRCIYWGAASGKGLSCGPEY